MSVTQNTVIRDFITRPKSLKHQNQFQDLMWDRTQLFYKNKLAAWRFFDPKSEKPVVFIYEDYLVIPLARFLMWYGENILIIPIPRYDDLITSINNGLDYARSVLHISTIKGNSMMKGMANARIKNLEYAHDGIANLTFLEDENEQQN